MKGDRQIRDIRMADVLEKRRLEQALNAKEFAVLAGISYSTARCWFHLSVFRGVVFWEDFAQWRTSQHGCQPRSENPPRCNSGGVVSAVGLPPRAARILLEA